MTENKELLHLIAEAPVTEVDQQGSNSVYMTVKMRMLSTQPNDNGHVVEASFIEEIVANQQFYAGTPVKGDTSRLARGVKSGLGHRFDHSRREYMTEQIGSLLSFEAVTEGDALVLYGTARIEKSHADICATIAEMYAEGSLYFSFEIVAKQVRREGELIYIGADRDNHLTGMCIVSIPAYKEAKAVRLVAEVNNEILEKAAGLTQWAAELEVSDVRCKLYARLFNDSDAVLKGWSWSLHELGVDYAMLKQYETGQRKMVKYHVENDDVVIDEVYDIKWVRADAPDTPLEAAEAEPQPEPGVATEAEAETEAEVATEAEPETSAETEAGTIAEPEAEAESESVPEAAPDAVEAAAQPMALPPEVAAELAELREYKRRTESAHLEAQRKAKRDELEQLVKNSGLQPDALSEAIDALDYEAVCASLMSASQAEDDPPEVNPMISDGMPLGTSKWDGYISDPTGL